MRHTNEGHNKLIKVILNKKIALKFNYQELEELNFALSDRFYNVKQNADSVRYLKFIKKLIVKIRNKIEEY